MVSNDITPDVHTFAAIPTKPKIVGIKAFKVAFLKPCLIIYPKHKQAMVTIGEI
jgi:hypothetical protein